MTTWTPLSMNGHTEQNWVRKAGPAALTEGLRQLHAILARVAGCSVPGALLPAEKTDPEVAL